MFCFSAKERVKITSRIAANDHKASLRESYINNLYLPISDAEMIQKYSETKINLGFLEVYDRHNYSGKLLQHLHLREFELPMCGALYFTNYSDELAEFYECDKEIIIYRNEHELLNKVQYYLNHPAEAEKVRQAGYRRATKCHTYQKRFMDLFSLLNIKI